MLARALVLITAGRAAAFTSLPPPDERICNYESVSAGSASLAAQQHFASMPQDCQDYLFGLGDSLGNLTTICACYTRGDEAAARAATCAPTAGARTVSNIYERCVNPPPGCGEAPCSGTCSAAVANFEWWTSLSPTCQAMLVQGAADFHSFCRCYTSGVYPGGATCSGAGSIPGYGTTEEQFEACRAVPAISYRYERKYCTVDGIPMYETCGGCGAARGACSGDCTNDDGRHADCKELSWVAGGVSTKAVCRDGVHVSLHFDEAGCKGKMVEELDEQSDCYKIDQDSGSFAECDI